MMDLFEEIVGESEDFEDGSVGVVETPDELDRLAGYLSQFEAAAPMIRGSVDSAVDFAIAIIDSLCNSNARLRRALRLASEGCRECDGLPKS